ncbi:alkyl/aryl-sulfatase [Caulobacter sp. 17J80-11]|uniref:alkyl/aryl-sulfatase n=1 Tax=Caulobacter sp. 17J80-11 TaxID=2763502 RepID=UPI00165344D5|nr:alkyl sulfatase dimerization domain-containing protein [Caulobacter sp. 17J80-11]MBC6980364.1 MBL fold metallo-hydrolase [Caulobacter sp. 17J80-11]
MHLKSAALALLAAVAATTAQAAEPAPADATSATRTANAGLLDKLPFADKRDFEDAARGFLGSVPGGEIRAADGRVLWSQQQFDFLKGETAPATVNPSLWRQARLNTFHGLFRVTDRVYQVRGLDVANMTIVEGDSGLIVVDALTIPEAAKAGLELYYAHRPRKPVVAVIYTHAHADHFGGVRGLISDADVAAGKAVVIAPDGFMAHATAENVLAGNAMSRRAQYQFGPLLPPGERGLVDTGLGKTVSRGAPGLIAPTDVIAKPFDTRRVDGVDIEFQLAPGSESPAEMHLYFPQFRVLDMAENATRTMHNLYTLRGAEVRDGSAWSRYLGEALQRYGDRTDVLIAQHHWPTFDPVRARELLANQRDLYKYVNDQSLRLANQGLKPADISAMLKPPPGLEQDWATRGYYGTLSHNAKAVYQKYLGWYDANPANLDPLPTVEQAKKTIAYMGGSKAVLKRARADYAQGEYRWVAQVTSQLVFADPADREARELSAAALEQLGYQAESAIWRNAYLTGAKELREGAPTQAGLTTLSADVLKGVDLPTFFDFLGVRLNGERAAGKRLLMNWTFPDRNETYVLNLEHAALTWLKADPEPKADVSLVLDRATLDAVTLKQLTLPEALAAGRVRVQGDPRRLVEFLGLLDDFSPTFPIVEPPAAP